MNDPAAPSSSRPADLVGARWARGFAVALLAVVACITAARWLERPSAALEEVVQTPVPAAVPTPTPAVLAPDPGDNP